MSITSNSELPDSWMSTRLENVVERRHSREDPQEFPDLPYVGLKHIREQKFGLHGKSRSEEYQSTSVHFFPGDILYGRLRPYLNKVHLADFEGLGSGEIIALTPKGDVYSRYLAHLLNSQEFVRYANHRSTGDRPRVNYNKIKKFEVPIPPLSEQKSIVKKIEQLFSNMDSGVSGLKMTQNRCETYRRSVLKSAIRGEMTREWREKQNKRDNFCKEWKKMHLSDLGKWSGGKTPRKSNDDYWGGSIPWVSPKEMKRNFIQQTEEQITDFAVEQNSVKVLPSGTVLIVTRSGILEHSLPVAVSKNELAINQDLKSLIPNKETSPEFLLYWFEAFEQDILQDCSKDGTTVASINSDSLYEYEISLPSLIEQKKIVDLINNHLFAAEEANNILKTNFDRAERLRNSILKYAFEGNLVPQNPTEDPQTIDGGNTDLEQGAQATLPEVTNDVK